MILFYDVETSGLPDHKSPSEAPHQPHIVQMGAILVNDHYDELQRLNMVVRPEGWEIPEEVSRIHGITQEYALEHGAPEDVMMGIFTSMWKKAGCRVAFNDPFDARLVRIFYKRNGLEDLAEDWKSLLADCAMKRATLPCNIPPTEKMLRAGFNRPKSPKLEEAVRILLGKEMVGAHSAIIDVEYTIEVYRHLLPPGLPLPTP